MFKLVAVGVVLTSVFSDYPSFVKPGSAIEAFTDKGPIVEYIVRCRSGAGILSYSKVEKLYCSSKHRCWPRLSTAIEDTCG